MQCPVCGAEAQDLSPGDFDGMIVACKRCGDYEIESGALNDLLRLDFSERMAALETGKREAAPQTRPVIRTEFLSVKS